ncbi:diguanylate cyclase [Deinococcus sp.]|uniref:GGDEF domain-containing protein n=1 Tax=Deinococcus sp. TaxID=47478 RepID=UPI0025C59FE0|nr:diguanylate cyclase [Deinococcus sp.]
MSAPLAPGLPGLPTALPPELLAQWHDSASDRERARTLVAIARFARQSSMHAAQQLGQAALNFAMQASAPEEAVLALIGLGFVAAHLNQPDRSQESVARATELIHEHGLSHLLSSVVNVRALAQVLIGDTNSARQDLQEALSIARQEGHPVDIGNALINLGWLANSTGNPDEALHQLNLLEEHIHTLSDTNIIHDQNNYLHENRAAAYVLLARRARERGRPEAVEQAARQGLTVLRAATASLRTLPDPSIEMICHAHESALHLLLGNLSGAQQAADRAAAMSSDFDQQLYIDVPMCRAELYEAQGNPAAALAHYQQALTLVRSQKRHRDTQVILRAMAALHERAGQFAQALQVTRDALQDTQEALKRVNMAAQRHLSLAQDLQQARRDASSWQDRLRHAETLARQDTLTGLLNRRGLEEGLLAMTENSTDLLATLFLDIDHFKRVNERHSHAGGDQALRGVAGLLRAQLTRRPQALLARYGGEEFVLVTPVANATQAHALAEACRRAVADHDWSALLPGTKLTASVGYAVEPGERLSEALTQADEHLYRAKRAGRNRVYPPSD